MSLDSARDALAVAAKTHATINTVDTLQALCAAASAYHLERVRAAPKAQTKEATTLTLPFGFEKGKPLNEAKTTSLKWVANAVREGLDNPDKANFRAANVALIEAIERELESR